MRNWNSSVRPSDRTGGLVCIVPMRNWNDSQIEINELGKVSLYRTYEELKHRLNTKIVENGKTGLYRTYEELKPRREQKSFDEKTDCLYRTYEELKH